ncbi:MAG: BatA domain-containing protein [Chloroflexi bacterium]|nr:BatA domain-containing protein [Chloroflexota bacterium]
MTFLQPAGLWLLGLIPLVLLIYLLRSNPRRQTVPSAFLWKGLNRDLSASRRWRPPSPSLLLLLQLLAIGVVALAVANPRMTAPPRRHLFLLLDASASMLATDVQPSRFEDAIRQARGLLLGLGPQDRATVIRVGPSPRVVAEDVDTIAAQAALTELRAGAGSATMREALMVASSLAGRVGDATGEAVVLSDGAFGELGDLAGLSVPVRFQTVGWSSENQAVAALSVVRQPQQAGGLAAFARVVNYADGPVRLPVRLVVDGIAQETRDVEVAGRRRSELSFAVPEGSRRVGVSLGGQDVLAADDQAELAVEAGHARQVLLVSRLPETLERALRAIPDLRVQTVSPEGYSGAGAELVVFDGVLPERLPSGQLLIVNPPGGRDYLKVVGETRSVQVTDFDPRHPLLESVDLSAARMARATVLEAPPWARVVADTVGRPLILEGRESGRSIVVFAFDPSGSSVDKMLAFPLLVSNAVAFLSGGELTPSLPPGRSATLPVGPGVREVRLEGPEGARALPVEGSSVRIERLEAPGRYTVRERGDGAGEARTFSINVADEAESDLTPRPRVAIEAAPRGSEQPSLTRIDYWPALLALGLVVFGAEWWRFGRRG